MANIPGVTCPISPLAQDNKTGSAAQQQLNDKKGLANNSYNNKTTIIWFRETRVTCGFNSRGRRDGYGNVNVNGALWNETNACFFVVHYWRIKIVRKFNIRSVSLQVSDSSRWRPNGVKVNLIPYLRIKLSHRVGKSHNMVTEVLVRISGTAKVSFFTIKRFTIRLRTNSSIWSVPLVSSLMNY